MTILNDNLLNALKSAKPKEVRYVANILDRSIKKGISIYEAAKIEKYQPGTKVTFSDKSGFQHVGVVEKVMTKRIRLFDKTTKAIVNIYPQHLRAYVPKTYAPRMEGNKVEESTPIAKRKYVRKAISGVDSPTRVKRKYVRKAHTIVASAPRVKRKYVRKAISGVDLTPLLKKYARASNVKTTPIGRIKRKYVRKAVVQ